MMNAHEKVDDLLDRLNSELFPKLDGLQVQSSAGLSNVSKTSMDVIFALQILIKIITSFIFYC